ncbi:MAG: PAS domain S-box protein [Myxococcales bacterium]|nr:PAS domain S-box protein [Myxococcales bacterium]
MGEPLLQARLEAAVQLVLRIASGEFNTRGETTPAADDVDAIITGLNMLAEDLQSEQQARREAEELLRDERDAYETAPALFCSVDAVHLRVIKCNRTMATTLQTSQGNILGRAVSSLCVPDQRQELEELLRAVPVGTVPTTAEVRLQRGDGQSELLVAMSATRTAATDGEERLRLVFQDLTALRETEAALYQSEEKHRTYVQHAPCGIFVVDETGHYVDVNAAACRLTGYSKDELLQRSIAQLVPTELVDPSLALFGALRELGHAEREVVLQHRDGSHVDVSLIAVALPSNRYMAFCEDIRAKKRAEAEREELAERLRQSQKMEAVGQLAGGIAHDFNNVLTAIMGNAEMSLQDLDPKVPIAVSLQEILVASQRAADLTTQLLAFSRKQVVAPRTVDLNELVHGLRGMLARLVGESIELVVSAQKDPALVKIDPSQAQQILFNLVINARDAMPDGGRLRIETAMATPDVAQDERSSMVSLSVSDTGSGMTEEVRARAFEPFFTTKELGRGTGLGLATVYGIVHQNHGHVSVASSPDKGTTVEVQLPTTLIACDGSPRSHTSRPAPRVETILLVEDEDMLRRLGEQQLRRHGYCVLSAGCGSEALGLVDRHHEPIDLLLTDLVMPGMNGRELAEQLAARFPKLRVLFTSGYAPDVVAHHGVLEPDAEFIPKPYTLQALARRVREVLEQAS